MGNMTGSASGAAEMTNRQKGLYAAGTGIQQVGKQQEALIEQLARMGPPPQMPLNTAPAPSVGADIAGQYRAQLRPPNVNYRSRQDNQLNPSVGQLLTQGGV